MKQTLKTLYDIDASALIQYTDKVYKVEDSSKNEYCLKYINCNCKKEIVEKQIFGYSTNYCHDYDKILGDYLMVSKDEYTLFFENYDSSGMLSTHAGGTEREGLINISVYNNL